MTTFSIPVIQFKRSNDSDAKPSALLTGEIAINLKDRIIYTSDSDNVVALDGFNKKQISKFEHDLKSLDSDFVPTQVDSDWVLRQIPDDQVDSDWVLRQIPLDQVDSDWVLRQIPLDQVDSDWVLRQIPDDQVDSDWVLRQIPDDQVDSDWVNRVVNNTRQILRNEDSDWVKYLTLEDDSDYDLFNSKIANILDRFCKTTSTNFSHVGKAPILDSNGKLGISTIPYGIVKSVNGAVPDLGGNVNVALGKVISGNQDDRPLLANGGDIYIVSGDSDSTTLGTTYIYDSDNGWQVVQTYQDGSVAAKYVKIAGDQMAGPLYVLRTPTADSEATSKHYVDSRFNGVQSTLLDLLLNVDSDILATNINLTQLKNRNDSEHLYLKNIDSDINARIDDIENNVADSDWILRQIPDNKVDSDWVNTQISNIQTNIDGGSAAEVYSTSNTNIDGGGA